MVMRRRGRPGDYLITDDITGCTTYHSKVRKDYWNNLTEVVLKRNLQEISQPLNDPYPVKEYRGPQYEFTDACMFEMFPNTIGNTLVPFNKANNPLSSVVNFNPAIPDMEIGCTFIVQADPPPAVGFITTMQDVPITTMGGDYLVI